jgi:hypothetical protein
LYACTHVTSENIATAAKGLYGIGRFVNDFTQSLKPWSALADPSWMEHKKPHGDGGALGAADFCSAALGGGNQDERRREPRIACDRQIEILPTAAARKWGFISVRLLDCSVHGLCLVTTEPMPAGAEFMAMLDIEDLFTLVRYTVRHCKPINPSQYKVGAQFVEFVSAAGDHDATRIMRALTGEAHSNE